MSTKKVDIRKLLLLCEINFSQKKFVFEMRFIELCFQYRCKKDCKEEIEEMNKNSTNLYILQNENKTKYTFEDINTFTSHLFFLEKIQ